MKKVLGLDIGTNSVGWAFILEDDELNNDVVDAGVRIISADSTVSTDFEKGRPATMNAKRRTQRGIRRGLQRYKQRRELLQAALGALQMMPTDELLLHQDALTLYGLRDKALREQLSLHEIGRILMHLNQRRGYKSNRKAQNNDETEAENTDDNATKQSRKKTVPDDETEPTNKPKKKGLLDAINERETLLKGSGNTIGQFFYQQLATNPVFRVREQTFMRDTYRAEFDAIWDFQAPFYPDVLNEARRVWLRDEIIYYQRKLKSQKHLISNCAFEVGHKAIPRSAPLFQTFKIWQLVNNVEISNIAKAMTEGYDIKGNRRLTNEERQKVFNYLEQCKTVKGRKVLKDVLSLNPTTHTINYVDLDGDRTKYEINSIFERFNYNGTAIFGNQAHYNDLWHKLYSIELPEEVVKCLQRPPFSFSSEMAKAFARVRLTPDYGSVSARAIRRLLPHLANGLDYYSACTKVALDAAEAGKPLPQYNEQNETKADRLGKVLDAKLLVLQRGALRNPVVEQIVNQVINVVNSIIQNPDYVTEAERNSGEFEIRVELARSLKSDAKKRDKETKQNAESKKRNDAVRTKLHDMGVPATGRNVERYKLWQDQNGHSPYSLKEIKPIPFSDLFDTAKYDIDHILPQSRFFDDSMSNKVIAERIENAKKGKMTGYEYMQSKGMLKDYVTFVNDTFKSNRGKKDRLLADTIPEDFIARQLKETQYITKTVVKELKGVCHNVFVTSGQITSHLRKIWGLDDVLQELNEPQYEKMGKITVNTDKHGKRFKHIEGWSKRDDHRNHAVDALIVAFTSQGMIQKFNTLNARNPQSLEADPVRKNKAWYVEPPMQNLHQAVLEATDRILVSHRQNNKVVTKNINKIYKGAGVNKVLISTQETLTPRGQMHKESVYGEIRQAELVELNARFNNWDNIADDTLKVLVLERLAKHGNDPKKAFASYDKNPILVGKNRDKPLKQVPVWVKKSVIRYVLNQNFKFKDTEYIVDERIKALVYERFAAHNNDPKTAFIEPLMIQAGTRQIPVKAVRCFTGLSNLVQLPSGGFVQSGNNHHLALYQNAEGKFQTAITSFWEAVERAKAGEPIKQAIHPEHGQLINTFAQNDMFVIGLDPNTTDFFDKKNKALVAKHLYRLQKISIIATGALNIWFRLHTASKLEDVKDKELVATNRELKIFYNVQSIDALIRLIPVKVRLNNLGKIVKILKND
jgi:CRISPR-associated endonuclease Csn1